MNIQTGESHHDWWRRAEREGRLHPGNGPEYTRRILPNRRPFLRSEALASGLFTRRRLERDFDVVAKGVLAHPLPPDTPRQVRGDDPGPFLFDIVTRARAMFLLHEQVVIGFWAALAMHGLLYWADAAPVVLLTDDRQKSGPGSTRKAALAPLAPVYRRWPTSGQRQTCTPDPRFPGLRCVTAPIATVQCLKTVLSGAHVWPVPEVPGLTDTQVRGVQLLDAVFQCTTATADDILDACPRILARHRILPLLSLADDGAQSPRETLLRLVVRDALPTGFHWSSQVPVSWGSGRGRRTVLDLACEELKVAVYYDGSTHREDAQTVKDIDQMQELKDMDWEVLRVDAELFANRRKLRRLLDNMIARALAGRKEVVCGESGEEAA